MLAQSFLQSLAKRTTTATLKVDVEDALLLVTVNAPLIVDRELDVAVRSRKREAEVTTGATTRTMPKRLRARLKKAMRRSTLLRKKPRTRPREKKRLLLRRLRNLRTRLCLLTST